jgi:hypothetical protein
MVSCARARVCVCVGGRADVREQVFKAYSVQTLTEATSFVQDLKLGHYVKVPPRATFMGACLVCVCVRACC